MIDCVCEVLSCVRAVGLPDCFVAVGFVRNCIWDSVFGVVTPLNDVDVIYFFVENVSSERDRLLEVQLQAMCPNVPWSVNECRQECICVTVISLISKHAMAHWPEKQTAIGVRLEADNTLLSGALFSVSVTVQR